METCGEIIVHGPPPRTLFLLSGQWRDIDSLLSANTTPLTSLRDTVWRSGQGAFRSSSSPRLVCTRSVWSQGQPTGVQVASPYVELDAWHSASLVSGSTVTEGMHLKF